MSAHIIIIIIVIIIIMIMIIVIIIPMNVRKNVLTLLDHFTVPAGMVMS